MIITKMSRKSFSQVEQRGEEWLVRRGVVDGSAGSSGVLELHVVKSLEELIVLVSRLVGLGSKSKETLVKIGEAPERLGGKDSIPLKNLCSQNVT
jgi:hypothetical protein